MFERSRLTLVKRRWKSNEMKKIIPLDFHSSRTHQKSCKITLATYKPKYKVNFRKYLRKLRTSGRKYHL